MNMIVEESTPSNKKINNKFYLKALNQCNYTIAITPQNNDKIFFSLNDIGYLMTKENFLSLTQTDIDKEIKKEKYIQKITDAEETITCALFSSDDNTLLFSDQIHNINKYNIINNIITDSDNNQAVKLDKTQLEIDGLKTWKFNISPNNNILVTGDNSIIVFDIESNKLIKKIESKSKFIYSFCFLDNTVVSVGNSNGVIQLYNLENDQLLNKFEEQYLSIRNLAFNKEKNILYSACDDLHITPFDVITNKSLPPIVGHKEPISDLVYNEENKLLITSSFDGEIKIFDTNDQNKCIKKYEVENKSTIWDIAVSNKVDFIGYTAEQGIGAFLIK